MMSRVLALISLTAISAPAAAASLKDYQATFAAAEAHAKEAASRKDQWPATTAALAAAKKEADAQNYDKAVALAQEADALARASLYQSETEAEAWKDAEIR